MPRAPARAITLSTFGSGSHLVIAENQAPVMRHSHRSVCLTAMRSGQRVIDFRSRQIVLRVGEVLVVSPGAVHGCKPGLIGDDETSGYVCLCVPPERLFAKNTCVLKIPSLAAALLAVTEATEPALLGMVQDALDCGGQLWGLDEGADLQAAPVDVRAALQGLEAMSGSAMQPVSLDMLADWVQQDAVRLSRRFSAHVGMPPIAWQMMRRIQAAAALLAQQQPIADVAVMAGFYDQSHFAHRFSQVMGMTPGQYMQAFMKKEC